MTRPHIAYFSPLPPARSGIADHSAELLPALAAHVDITLFAEEPATVTPALAQAFPILAASEYPRRRWLFDLPLYHMGNNTQFHEWIYRLFLRYPGMVVLHDFALHHFIVHRTVGTHDNFPGYARELGFVFDLEGYQLAWRIAEGLEDRPVFKWPLNDRLLELALGIVVHSDYVKQRLAARRPDRPAAHVPLLVTGRPHHSRRAKLNLPPETVIFGSVGQLLRIKQIELALQTFADVHRRHPASHYLLIGETLPNEVNLPALLDKLSLHDAVTHLGYVSDLQTFLDWVAACDVIVSLRHPTLGETSAGALRAMSAARPLIVFDHGWYREIPEAACYRVPPLDGPALAHAMLDAITDSAGRVARGVAAQEYVTAHHNAAAVARQYAQFIEQVRRALLKPE